jgi:hypothetical protein
MAIRLIPNPEDLLIQKLTGADSAKSRSPDPVCAVLSLKWE